MRIGTSRGVRPVGGLAVASLGVVACSGGAGGGSASHPVTVAVVANPDMQQTEQSVGTFAKGNPGITVTFDTLPEDQERAEISFPATPFSSLRRFIHEFFPI